ncbi:MAG: hydantoinase [Candidatus Obscuribacter sp.]|nr:hydantoinase [Candidatus Obscuribacter sp.]
MTEQNASIRIGIDVGGPCTHAVAIDASGNKLIGKAKVPTSHSAPEGVARGIVEALHNLLESADIASDQVSFIAHSTTQATNALLEGDVAKVGILGMSTAALAPLAKSATKLGRVPLAQGIYMETAHKFIVVPDKKPVSEALVEAAIKELSAQGCTVIAVSEAFSVDSPGNEELVLAICQRMNLLATSGSEVSRLYGLKVRTRTAAINAAILPKMIESANLTEESVRKSGINAPIMIMRSDGGVMDIDSMRKRPILSILSGPAAGVAAAMMFLKISDGVFLEVGGTSTDISAIANGRALVRSAEIGGHKVYMRTLDVRTIGVAGGSMPRLSGSDVIDIGPRSAHIAGLKYASFVPPLAGESGGLTDSSRFASNRLSVLLTKPLPKDPADYLELLLQEEPPVKFTLTPTCASNLLGLVPDGDCARGNLGDIKAGFAALAKHLGKPVADQAGIDASSNELATRMLTLAADKCIPTVKALIAEHKLDSELTVLVGGGGGAAAIVPFVGKTMGLTATLAEHADVISAIGVAMALIRETIEKQVASPAAAGETILAMRQEVFEAVHKMGADPATIEVHIEIDSKTSIVRATACGASKATGAAQGVRPDDEARCEVAAKSLRLSASDVSEVCRSNYFTIYGAKRKRHAELFGIKLPIMGSETFSLRVVDLEGVVRLQATSGAAKSTTKEAAEDTISELIEAHSLWGDAGKTIPDIMLLLGAKIIDLSGLLNESQVLTLARPELASLPANHNVLVLAKF